MLEHHEPIAHLAPNAAGKTGLDVLLQAAGLSLGLDPVDVDGEPTVAEFVENFDTGQINIWSCDKF